MNREVLIARGKCCGLGCKECPYLPKWQKESTIVNDLFCEFCKEQQDTAYEGWFYNSSRNNEFFSGTVDSGLITLRVSCKDCFNKMLDLGLTKSKTRL